MPHNDIVADLKDAFPRQAVSLATFNTYLNHLDDVQQPLLRAAVTRLIRSEEFFPSISKIRETCADLTLKLPTADEAIGQIEARRTWRRERDAAAEQYDSPPPIDRLTLRVLQNHFGGINGYLNADNPGMAAAQFTKTYNQARQAEIVAMQTGSFSRALPPADR